MAKKPDLSTITGEEGYDSKYSLSEFRDYLKVDLLPKNCKYGTVFWRPERYQRSEYELYSGSNSVSSEVEEKIKRGLVAMADSCGWWPGFLVQFWAPKLDGQLHYLTTSDQPFCLPHMSYGPDYYYKGLCQYRKLSMDHQYCVVDKEGGKEEQLGPVGRVYRNKRPESSPDLRLYSTNEFPLRDRAARCGLRRYVALPIFDNSLNNEFYGVLEILTLRGGYQMSYTIRALYRGLQAAGLKSTHINFKDKLMHTRYDQLPAEISQMIRSAIKVVPQLHTAQVWVPCKQCADMSNNLTCMERAAFMKVEDGETNWYGEDADMSEYLKACELHNLQIEKGFARALISSKSKSCFIRNLCDYSISENPLAHYAQKTRLSLYFALCLESVQDCNDLYVIEFFLQSNCREDARGGSFLHLLSRIMEMKLKGFKFASERQLQEELLIESRQPTAIGYESTEYAQEREYQNSEELNILMVMEQPREIYSESEFTNYLQMAGFCYHQSPVVNLPGWTFWMPVREELSKNEFSSATAFVPSEIQPIQEKIKLFIFNLAFRWMFPWDPYILVQFWAPKMEKDRCYLATSNQPFAFCRLPNDLVLFRKQCMEHHYFVDERVKEEQLGPPGRVFRNGHPEMTPDLRLYSTREFPLRHHAAHCYRRKYVAIPVFEDKSCVGVLEFIGFRNLEVIGEALEAANLSSTHPNCKPSLQAIGLLSDEPALKEVKEAHELVTQIPHVYKAEVWVPYNECASINSNICCMRRALSTKSRGWENYFPKHRIVQTGKGIAGMVLASENKSCFFRNTCDFSIAEEPLALYHRRERLDACFAICLQSSYTGNLLYVLEFFLYQGPLNYEYFWPSVSFLLLILEQKLTSFKFASAKKLGEELVVEVIESEANKLSFSELNQQDIFPFKFNIVPYGRKEHQRSKSQKVQDASDGVDPVRRDAHAMRCNNAAANFNKDDAAKKTDKGKRKTGFYLTREELEPRFGKRLKDVAEALGVGRSTIKRACRECGIHRWPCYETNKKNPSLFETESAYKIVQDSGPNTCPSTSNNHILLETPLHQNVLQTSTERRQHSTVWPKAQRVIVKAKYDDDIIKFDLGHSAGMNGIVQEVARRLNLKMGSFKLKYLDEDNDKILLACDVDLQDCLKSLTALGKTFLELFVESIGK